MIGLGKYIMNFDWLVKINYELIKNNYGFLLAYENKLLIRLANENKLVI